MPPWASKTGRGERIRTSGLRYPKPSRYQAAPRPDGRKMRGGDPSAPSSCEGWCGRVPLRVRTLSTVSGVVRPSCRSAETATMAVGSTPSGMGRCPGAGRRGNAAGACPGRQGSSRSSRTFSWDGGACYGRADLEWPNCQRAVAPCGADRLDGTLGRGGSTEPEKGARAWCLCLPFRPVDGKTAGGAGGCGVLGVLWRLWARGLRGFPQPLGGPYPSANSA